MDITYIFTLKAVLIKAFLMKLFLYDVIILKWNPWVIPCDPPFIEWHVRCPFKTFISLSFLKQEMHESLL